MQRDPQTTTTTSLTHIKLFVGAHLLAVAAIGLAALTAADRLADTPDPTLVQKQDRAQRQALQAAAHDSPPSIAFAQEPLRRSVELADAIPQDHRDQPSPWVITSDGRMQWRAN